MNDDELMKFEDVGTEEELYRFAGQHGVDDTAHWLFLYVMEGQPDHCCPGSTSRRMCSIASLGVEGKPFPEGWTTLTDTKYGSAFYFAMWGDGKIEGDPNDN